MKEINIESLVGDVRNFPSSTEGEQVLITHEGKPVAVLVTLANKDREDWALENSPEFWRMIEERRREPVLPWNDVKATLLAGE